MILRRDHVIYLTKVQMLSRWHIRVQPWRILFLVYGSSRTWVNFRAIILSLHVWRRSKMHFTLLLKVLKAILIYLMFFLFAATYVIVYVFNIAAYSSHFFVDIWHIILSWRLNSTLNSPTAHGTGQSSKCQLIITRVLIGRIVYILFLLDHRRGSGCNLSQLLKLRFLFFNQIWRTVLAKLYIILWR